MADARAVRPKPLTPDTYERVLAAASVILGATVVVALVKGRAHWGEVPALIWLHLFTIGIALALTPTMLLSVRGTARHRLLGRIWAICMLATALMSFGIHASHPGGYSFVHLISAATLLLVPRLWWTARHHQVLQHRRAVRGLVTGALLVAGFFTFPFHRMLGDWLFG